jgi:hypothetical protein
MISRFSPFAISFTLTSLFFINLCNLIFRCGCRSLWAGAAVACNIHAQQRHHCPWCSHGTGGRHRNDSDVHPAARRMLHSMELARPRDCGDGNVSDSRIGHRGRESILTLDGNCGLRPMENVVKLLGHAHVPS